MNLKHIKFIAPNVRSVLIGLVAYFILCPLANASGDQTVQDPFVARFFADVDADHYEAGELGILLPTYSRLNLYPAWRAILMGRKDLQASNTILGGFRRTQNTGTSTGWVGGNDNSGADGVADWMKSSHDYAPAKQVAVTQGIRSTQSGFSGYVICPSPAFKFAVDTLSDLVKRKDATPARLREWVAGQNQVFAFCDYDKNANRGPDGKPTIQPSLPAPLPASESTYWRQLREYQIASAAFYADDFKESTRLFTLIGADKLHPMYLWGDYMALRSRARSADLGMESDNAILAIRSEIQKGARPGESPQAAHTRLTQLQDSQEKLEAIWRQKLLAELTARVARIVDDKSLSKVHETARATLRTMQSRLAPMARFAELSDALDNLSQDPYANDRFNDWYFLSNNLVGAYDERDFEPGFRKKHAFFDWMRSLQRCGLDVQETLGELPPSKENTKALCRSQYDHAVERWNSTRGTKGAGNPNEAKAWLVAALMLADSLPEELERAGLSVPADAPEYLTVRYNLMRLYQSAGKNEKVINLFDPGMAFIKQHVPESMSAQNLLKQLRFSVATSPADAINYLMRFPVNYNATNAPDDTKPSADSIVAGDGKRWLNSGLSVQELVELAQNTRINTALRTQIAISAWTRADLLENLALANSAASLAGSLAPALKSDATHYVSIPTKDDKHHAILIAMLYHDLHPLVQSYQSDFSGTVDISTIRENATASMWCSLPLAFPGDWTNGETNEDAKEHLPAPLTISSNPSARDAETKELSHLKTATGYLGDHVLQWAKLHPKDPDIPWLLHVVVVSTRGGCLDPGASKLSRSAYSLLHTRYKTSEWADKTTVWY